MGRDDRRATDRAARQGAAGDYWHQACFTALPVADRRRIAEGP